MVNLCERNLHLVQDAEDTVSASGVHHKKIRSVQAVSLYGWQSMYYSNE